MGTIKRFQNSKYHPRPNLSTPKMKLWLVSVLVIFYIIDPSTSSCVGGDTCCTPNNKCGQWEGDCDTNNDCQEGLECGTDNCLWTFYESFQRDDDCCQLPPPPIGSYK